MHRGSLFYFELDSIPERSDGNYVANGRVLCSLRCGDVAFKALFGQLSRKSAQLLLDGRPVTTLNGQSCFAGDGNFQRNIELRTTGPGPRVWVRAAIPGPLWLSATAKAKGTKNSRAGCPGSAAADVAQLGHVDAPDHLAQGRSARVPRRWRRRSQLLTLPRPERGDLWPGASEQGHGQRCCRSRGRRRCSERHSGPL